MYEHDGEVPRGVRAPRSALRGRLTVAAAFGLAAAVALAVPGVAQAGTPRALTRTTAPASASPQVRWSTETVAPGVQVRTGVLRNTGVAPVWTITVQAPAVNRLTGAATWAPLGDRAWADATEQRLRAAGFEPRAEKVVWDRYADTPRGTMGWQVRVGSYDTQAAAQSVNPAVAATGLRTAVEWTGYDGRQLADRESVHVAVIDPARFRGTVAGTHDGDVADRETTSSVAVRDGSLVAVNGGFFITADADGVQGTVAGIGAYDGELESMAAGSRAALILADGGRRPRIADLSTTVTARARSSAYAVQGINRLPGKVRNCGRPGATPTALPRHDTTCALPDDLVKFTPRFGAALPEGAGAQVVLDSGDRVVSSGPRGGRVPAGGSVLQGIGGAADWLATHSREGERISVQEDIRDSAGRRVELGAHDSIVSAAPTLVKNGRTAVDAATEGTLDPLDLSFGFAWSNVRQPRTMAGIDARGRLLLVTVDGRQPGVSEGFTLAEAAEFMRSLGAEQALNLDGGGSSAMVVGGTLVNITSDATGERAVGDTIQVIPAPRR
ncbi:phosphodiester glycosidase family protein [Streptomyces liangshanensis]|uniref:Phosphodiester glycosidase family protein n=1 Tax=Streptomyces liangshanensis TaxID=2717324 RepID=A0A6G9GTZ6_9ACTN|nr:phosphodiester glycosidase family protein [Streptomyces liangshanensis]QIQ01546.1 phosphodiester glycosidase family protein [Streptomyces liangshanensis]